jgi:3-hydroxy-3-methylglutaryl CoA synthase
MTDRAIPFTEEDVKKHLDDLIDFWRDKKSKEVFMEEISIAECYIDAYQSIRKNLFGELKDD